MKKSRHVGIAIRNITYPEKCNSYVIAAAHFISGRIRKMKKTNLDPYPSDSDICDLVYSDDVYYKLWDHAVNEIYSIDSDRTTQESVWKDLICQSSGFGMDLQQYLLETYLPEHADIEEKGDALTDFDRCKKLLGHAFAGDKDVSLQKTSTKKSQAFRKWLTQKAVKRQTVFILGIGLQMTVEKVSEFLKKSLGQRDIDFSDSEETVLWYCISQRRSLSESRKLLAAIEGICAAETTFSELIRDSADAARKICSEEALLDYLAFLRGDGAQKKYSDEIYLNFDRIYEDVQKEIADMEKTGKVSPNDVSSCEIEDMLYSTVDKVNGNYVPLPQKSTGKQQEAFCMDFLKDRLSRQRISCIKLRRRVPGRKDLLTLCFLKHSLIQDRKEGDPLTFEEEFSDRSYKYGADFIFETNMILVRCGMERLSAERAYDRYLLLCIWSCQSLELFVSIQAIPYKTDYAYEF